MSPRTSPIRRKLMAMLLVTSGAVLLITCASLLTYEILTFRDSTVRQITTLGKVIAANSTAALAFDNAQDAEEVLSALRAERHIVRAALYDSGGKLFARYPEDASVDDFPARLGAEGPRFEEWHLVDFQAVTQGGERRLGTLYLRADMGAMVERLRLYGLVAGSVIVVCLLVAYVLSRILQGQISVPILALAQAAKAVSDRRDYSVRAPQGEANELGLLTGAFNQMLTRIQEQTEELKESEERSRAVLNSALSAVFVTDAGGRIVDWNPRAEAMFGWTREEAMGLTLTETIIPPRHRDSHRRRLDAFVASGVEDALNRPIEMTALRRDGTEFPVELSLSPMRARDAIAFCGFATDITERMQAQEAIRILNEELEARVAERTIELESANKELEAFSYSVSHDLRAPLRHINGFVEMLSQHSGEGLDETGRRHLGVIAGSARRMGSLIDDLLVFSRMGRMEMRRSRVDLSEVVAIVVRELQEEASGRTIEWRIGDLPEVQGDAAMLRLVVQNLIGNAFKYTSPRAVASIEVGSNSGPDGEIVVYTRDNGVGFDMQYVDKLFGVFQRLHRSDEFEGTGIGLANVRRIVLRHGGRTWAEGKPDQGATFYFSIPGARRNREEPAFGASAPGDATRPPEPAAFPR